MKFKLVVKPGYLIPITLTFAVVLAAVTAFDIYQSYRDIYQAKSDEAVSLLRAVQKSGENVYLSSMEVENLTADKLLNNAYLIYKLEENKNLSERDLNKISETNNIAHIYLLTRAGRPELRNSNNPYCEMDIPGNYPAETDSIFNGKYDYFTAPSLSDQSGNQHMVVVHKRPGNKGLIALSVESKYFLEFRKKIGIGQLFQRIADEREIEYIVIQDSTGIITASRGVEQLSPVSSDSFLRKSMNEKIISTRKVPFKGKEVFEAVKPFVMEGEIAGVIRIGFSLESISRMIDRMILRSVLISVLLLLVGIVVITLLVNQQSYSLLKDEYTKVQTHTGKILESMSDGVIVAGASGKINIFNKAAEKIFGISVSEATGRDCSAIVKSAESLITSTLRTKSPVEYWEDLVQTTAGRQAIIAGSTSLIYNSAGEIDSVIAVVRDLTIQRSLEGMQKRQERLTAMGELAGNVAHEIKNPLNLISITAQRLEKEFEPMGDKAEYHALIKDMKEEIRRVTEIINQFLKFARPPKLRLRRTEMKDYIEAICGAFQGAALQKNVKLRCISESFEADIDQDQMKQALINLLQNAFDAAASEASRQGEICVESYASNGHLTIGVKDNGSGIKEEDINKIFNLYFTTKAEGTGLGLSIVNQIVTGHGGSIKVESNTEKGTTFLIEIPLYEQDNTNN
ncbi:MAG: PAS domain S-box protein [Ignavibacteria bacterium]|jgi:PAS domain S-box-containing protein|nr:PAS domain S-box protein [Ignavibacteria bacterium]MCU7504616.1 PAS domain S-box protein [Ignavibacteria bacterium]MCU7517968.1 PAS domain S-box protein [Ignavibacteria bacterium]